MSSLPTSSSGPVPPLGQARPIKSIVDVIDFLDDKATSRTDQILVVVLKAWHTGAGAPAVRHEIMIDVAMMQSIKGAMAACMDLLEYGLASNTKAVRYTHAIVQELYVQASLVFPKSLWPCIYLDTALKEAFRMAEFLAAEYYEPAAPIQHAQSHGNNIASSASRGPDTANGAQPTTSSRSDAASLGASRAPASTPVTTPAASAAPAAPIATSSASHPTLSEAIPKDPDDFPTVIIQAARSVPPLPKPWFNAPNEVAWVAAEILLIVYEETRGPFRPDNRPQGFPISEWCRYRLHQWGFNRRTKNSIESRRSQLGRQGWNPILEAQADMLVGRGLDPGNIATRKLRTGVMGREKSAAPGSGQTDDIWERDE